MGVPHSGRVLRRKLLCSIDRDGAMGGRPGHDSEGERTPEVPLIIERRRACSTVSMPSGGRMAICGSHVHRSQPNQGAIVSAIPGHQRSRGKQPELTASC
jgi:hypothetical protein